VAAPVQADTLYESIQGLVKTQKQIKAAEADVVAAEERVKAAWGDWDPELSVTANGGREKQNKTPAPPIPRNTPARSISL